MILAGRRLNDDMGRYVANRVIKLMIRRGIEMPSARILVMGLTFKENCPDLRNTRVIDIIHELKDYGLTVDVVDPWVDAAEAEAEYRVTVVTAPRQADYDAIVLAVAHREFCEMPIEEIRGWLKERAVLFDVKQLLPAEQIDGSL